MPPINNDANPPFVSVKEKTESKICERADAPLGENNERTFEWPLEEEEIELNHDWYDVKTEKFLRQLPKIELHVHLDGSFDPAILLPYLKSSSSNYDCLPVETFCPWDQSTIPVRALVQECKGDLEAFHSLCTCRKKYSLHEMIRCFEIFIPIVRGNLDLLELLSYDFVRRQAQQNIIYTEVRYSPHYLAKGGSLNGNETVDAGPVMVAVTKGLRRGEKDFGVKVNQILCCIAWRPDWADDVVTIANERRNDTPCAVVGVDIAAGEEHFDKVRNNDASYTTTILEFLSLVFTEAKRYLFVGQTKYPHLHGPHLQALNRAKELGLNITIHAGEVGDSTYVKDAVTQYGARRIGHGYRVATDKDLMTEMRERNVHFEVCPTSSLETGGWSVDKESKKNWRNHPSLSMIQNGLNVGFNSDDPAVFNTSLTWQLRIALGKMGITTDRLIRSVYDSIEAAFLSKDEKVLLKQQFEVFKNGDIHTEPRSLHHNFIERIL